MWGQGSMRGISGEHAHKRNCPGACLMYTSGNLASLGGGLANKRHSLCDINTSLFNSPPYNQSLGPLARPKHLFVQLQCSHHHNSPPPLVITPLPLLCPAYVSQVPHTLDCCNHPPPPVPPHPFPQLPKCQCAVWFCHECIHSQVFSPTHHHQNFHTEQSQ